MSSKFTLRNYEISKGNIDSPEKANIEKLNSDKENKTSDSMDSEDFKKCSEIPEAKPITQVLENKNVQLRRSTRRVILRTKEDFSPDPRVIKRKKRRSKLHKIIQGKKIPGRRGRPRKYPNHQFPKLSDKEWETTDSSKGLTSRNLPPKQIKERSNFCCPGEKYNDLMKQNYVPLSHEAVSQNSFHSEQAIRNDLFETPPNFLEPPTSEKQHLIKPSPCKPTIIYFKCPKNRQKVSISGNSYSKQRHAFKNLPQYSSHQEHYNFTHLRNKYSIINESILNHFYNVSKGDIAKTEMMLQDLLVKELKLLRGQDIYPIVENSERTSRVISAPKFDRIYTGCNSLQRLEIGVSAKGHYKKTEEVDTLYRQVIIDSIRLLYDEQSVTGYL